MDPLYEQCLKTALAFIESFRDPSPGSVVEHRGPRCLHRLRPESLDSVPMTNAQYSVWVQNLLPVVRNFQLHLHEDHLPMIDSSQRKVTLYLRSTGDTDFGKYSNEYIWILTLNDCGDVVDDVIEFADSKLTSDWIPNLTKAAEDRSKITPAAC